MIPEIQPKLKKKATKRKKRTSQSVEAKTKLVPFEKKKSAPMSKNEYWNFEFDKSQKQRKSMNFDESNYIGAKSAKRQELHDQSKGQKLLSAV